MHLTALQNDHRSRSTGRGAKIKERLDESAPYVLLEKDKRPAELRHGVQDTRLGFGKAAS